MQIKTMISLSKLGNICILSSDIFSEDHVSIRRKKACSLLFRHYHLPFFDRLAMGKSLGKKCRYVGTPLIMGHLGRFLPPYHIGGLHFPCFRLPLYGKKGWIKTWRRKPHWLLTTSAHTTQELMRAIWSGVDAILLAPIFHTQSHPERLPIGIVRGASMMTLVRRLSWKNHLRVIALGGINEKRKKYLKAYNIFNGIAGIRYFT